MTSDSAEISLQSTDNETPLMSNAVALIGVILAGVAATLCVLMFALASQLPDGLAKFSESGSNSPAHLRLLILGCSTAVLAVVALVLCVVGMFLPNRSRVLPIVGTVISVLMLLGVFGVLLVGVVMNPAAPAPVAVEELPSELPVEPSVEAVE